MSASFAARRSGACTRPGASRRRSPPLQSPAGPFGDEEGSREQDGHEESGCGADVEPAEGELVEELTKDQAEEVTRLLVGCLKNWHSFGEQVTELALRAYYGQAFKVLGYASWDAYATATFGELELPRSTQAAIHAALINGAEISARSAAAITGKDHKTAAADAEKARAATGEDSPVRKIRMGADGKKRPATKPPPQDNPAPGQEQSWARSPKYLGLGWQNVAAALGNLMGKGVPKLSKRARQDVEARLHEALAFLAVESRERINEQWDETFARLKATLERSSDGGAYFDDRVAKLLNLAMGTDSDDEAVAAFRRARIVFRDGQ